MKRITDFDFDFEFVFSVFCKLSKSIRPPPSLLRERDRSEDKKYFKIKCLKELYFERFTLTRFSIEFLQPFKQDHHSFEPFTNLEFEVKKIIDQLKTRLKKSNSC